MYFKLQYVLNELTISFKEQEPLSFSFGDKQNVSVTIRPATAEEKDKYKGNVLMCTAVTEAEPSSQVFAMFERLSNNLMPEDFKKAKVKNAKSKKEEYGYIDNEGRIEGEHIPPLSLFPKQFQAFASEVRHLLSESIKRTSKIIRWCNAINSSYNPVRYTRGLSWSFDNQHWRGMPHDMFLDVSFNLYPKVSDETHSQIEKLIQANMDEPLGHELFLEAWQLRKTNPRSALIIGIVAAEVGFKQCIGKLVPEAEWLANNAPSPPLHKMLSDYLPLLPAKLKIQGKVFRPPKSILTTLNKGVNARNKTVHVGSKPPEAKELKELLLSVRDLLYLLDVYCGFEWAIDNIRHEVKEEMVKEFGLKRGT